MLTGKIGWHHQHRKNGKRSALASNAERVHLCLKILNRKTYKVDDLALRNHQCLLFCDELIIVDDCNIFFRMRKSKKEKKEINNVPLF
jgi:hypothetical protein